MNNAGGKMMYKSALMDTKAHTQINKALEVERQAPETGIIINFLKTFLSYNFCKLPLSCDEWLLTDFGRCI